MRRSLLVLVSLGILASALAFGIAETDRRHVEDELRAARALLATPLRTAPELHDLPAAKALARLEALRREAPGAVPEPLYAEASALVELQRGDLLRAEGHLTEARLRDGWNVRRRVIAGALARASGRGREAQRHAEAALARSPGAPRALLLAGDLALDRGDGLMATPYLERLEERFPIAPVLNRLGLAAEIERAMADAEDAFERATRLDGRAHAAWLNLGRVRRARSDLPGARAAFEAAKRLQPGHPDAPLGLGLVALGQGDFDEARAQLARARELGPERPEPQVGLGDLAAAEGALEDAEAHYVAALDLRADALSWLKLGNVRLRRGHRSGAADAFRAAIARAPGLGAAHNGLGAVLLQSGDETGAARALEQATTLAPDDAAPWLNLALLAARRGDTDGSATAWREALRRDPSSEVARAGLA
ncbi:MAG: tetratricopeptide repeat protein, partial [Myxococcota bacterium]